jgi:hypothetical protein
MAKYDVLDYRWRARWSRFRSRWWRIHIRENDPDTSGGLIISPQEEWIRSSNGRPGE